MSDDPILAELGRLLGGLDVVGTGGELPRLPTDPVVHVEGLGTLTFPLSPNRLGKLLAHGEPAPFGMGEQTLTDTSVRHTWHFPDARVEVDWHGQLEEVLESAGRALGLPPSTRLTAELHSLLVYERGQFFAPHQDSQKDDAMVATLVVVLPSAFTGGELVVHDVPDRTAYEGSREHATMVAFYADRTHEVRPVRSGHRITLTYNLLLTGDAGAQPVEHDLVTDVAAVLAAHFGASRSRYGGQADPPHRLAYLLDHQYTPRGLSTRRLKGLDATAAAALGAAAERIGCEVVLALVDIREVRNAPFSPDQVGWDYGYEDDEDEWNEELEHDDDLTFGQDDLGVGDPEDGDAYLIDREVVVSHWLDADAALREVGLGLGDDEVAAATPTWRLRPYEAEHEGYMGNYGNTVDRWYKRAALLVWPRHLAFANRAEAAPADALRTLLLRLADGDEVAVREDLRGMLPVWPTWVRLTQHGMRGDDGAGAPSELLTVAIAVARFTQDTEIGDSLLAPFRIDDLRPDAVEHVVALAEERGAPWAQDLLHRWFSAELPFSVPRTRWVARLPGIVRAFGERRDLARVVSEEAWRRMHAALTPYLTAQATGRNRRSLAELAEPLAAVLDAASDVGAPELHTDVVELCMHPALLAVVLPVLGMAHGWESQKLGASGARELAEHAATLLRSEVDAPARATDDWSVTAPSGCGCDLCVTLGEFLRDRHERVLEWPIRKDRREHVHRTIQAAELPVSHVTRRTGSPFTLVLTKTAEVFEQEHRAREQARADLATLEEQWGEVRS